MIGIDKIRLREATSLDGDCYMKYTGDCEGKAGVISIPSNNLITEIRLCQRHRNELRYVLGELEIS